MADLASCASCATTDNLKQCARCKTVSYCSSTCQRAHWQSHKPSCHFKVTLPPAAQSAATADALSLLRTMPDPGTKQKVSSSTQKVFNIPELRLAVFSLLPALDLVCTQRVCRSWYLTSAFEKKLQQRMFFAPGPGELVVPSYAADKPHPALHPYNSSQRRALKREQDLEARQGSPSLYLLIASDGKTEELSSPDVHQKGIKIICNPFLTRFWPQNQENMTLIPVKYACDFPRAHSWRRMLLTSPPITSVSMSLWFTKRDNSGSQLLPSTGHVPTGVTLGHFADMLAAQPNKLEYHWMQPHGYAAWLRSADATTPLHEGGDKEHSTGYRGVYVNPSNGIAFPGGFGRGWRGPG